MAKAPGTVKAMKGEGKSLGAIYQEIEKLLRQ